MVGPGTPTPLNSSTGPNPKWFPPNLPVDQLRNFCITKCDFCTTVKFTVYFSFVIFQELCYFTQGLTFRVKMKILSSFTPYILFKTCVIFCNCEPKWSRFISVSVFMFDLSCLDKWTAHLRGPGKYCNRISREPVSVLLLHTKLLFTHTSVSTVKPQHKRCNNTLCCFLCSGLSLCCSENSWDLSAPLQRCFIFVKIHIQKWKVTQPLGFFRSRISPKTSSAWQIVAEYLSRETNVEFPQSLCRWLIRYVLKLDKIISGVQACDRAAYSLRCSNNYSISSLFGRYSKQRNELSFKQVVQNCVHCDFLL